MTQASMPGVKAGKDLSKERMIGMGAGAVEAEKIAVQ